ncbi:MAG: alpha-galactosidase, partial [Clostridia bacterium]|nr:alpha-galactosidase [Clostridia bacterium]
PCAGVNTFQVDDGYQTAVGDWLSVDSKKFPFGMRRVADAVHQRGLKAGLWLAPFAVQKNAYLAKKHPGWLVADKKGSPLMVGANWGGFYALDIYHKEARAYIKQVFQTVLHTWGFDMVKLDFLYAASVKPLYGKTRGQVAYDAMELLRECVGEDKLLLACGAPMLPSFGVADYMRIGADMALSWPHSARRRQMHREDVSTPNAVLNSVYRRGLNGRAFLNDPDVFLLRRNNISFTPEQQALLAKFIQLFGGVLFTSDDVSTYKPEQASLFADTLADTATLTDVSQEGDVLTVRYTQSDRPCIMQFNVYTGQIFAFGADEK